MDDRIKLAAILNNKAISLLASGVSKSALRNLKAALVLLGDDDDVDNSPKVSSERLELLSTYYAKQPLLTTGRLVGSESPETFAKPSSQQQQHPQHCSLDSFTIPIFEEHSQNFAFKRALSFNPNPDSSSGDTKFYCAVVMFNMALMVHLNKKYANNRKALQLYDLTLTLLHGALSKNYFESECKALIIATLNNKAELYYDSFQYDQVYAANNEILVTRTSLGTLPGAFDKGDLDGFLLSAMFRVPLSYAPAA